MELSSVNKRLENTQATLLKLKRVWEVITDGSVQKMNAEEEEQETKRSQFSQLLHCNSIRHIYVIYQNYRLDKHFRFMFLFSDGDEENYAEDLI